jgi:hypothetical protein
MRMTRQQISATIMEEYDLEKYFDGDVIHFEVNKGMYWRYHKRASWPRTDSSFI